MRQAGSEFVVTVSRFFVDLGPSGQKAYLLIHAMLLFIMVYLAVKALLWSKFETEKKSGLFRFFFSDNFYALVLFGFVLIGRFPNAVYGYQNPDEGVWIACAKALWNDPRPWLAADTSTSGPLVVLPLILLKVIGLPIDFGSIKLASAITLALSLAFTFLAYVRLFGSAVGRSAILILAVAVSMTSFWDFVAYNGEQLPLLLLSISLFLLSDSFSSQHQKPANFIVTGILLGSLPFAKLQSVPLGLFLGICGTLMLLFSKYEKKHIAYFVLSGLVPSLVFFAWIALFGGLSHFWNSFISFNLYYAVSGSQQAVTLLDKLDFGWRMLYDTYDATYYFLATISICFFCLFFLSYSDIWKTRRLLLIVLFSIFYFTTSLYCIGQSYRWFIHYTFFAFTSINLLMANLIYLVSKDYQKGIRHQSLFIIAIVGISLLYFYQRFSLHPNYLDYAETNKNDYAYMPGVIKVINKYSEPGDRIVIWGWSNSFFSDTDLILGSRFADTAGILNAHPYHEYLLEIFMTDLKRNTPRIFLDAITPSALQFSDRALYGIDKFPVVADYVSKNYNQVGEVAGYRIYARKK